MLSKKYIKAIKHGGFRLFIQTAQDLGVEIHVVFEKPRVLELQFQDEKAFCVGDCIPNLYRSSNVATKNKAVTKAILSRCDIRTPNGILASSYTELKEKMKKSTLRYPLIAKPLDQSFAHGVTWNIQTPGELKHAVLHIQKTSLKPTGKKQHFLIEEMMMGDEYRVLVFNGKVISCVNKVPATLTGDGMSTMKQLAHTFNRSRLPGFKIKLDKVVLKNLRALGLTPDSVLAKGQKLKLRNNMNMSDGGRSIDCTELMSQQLKQKCIKSLEALGMNYAGIDLITPNITSSSSPYAIIEINSLPYFNMNEKPLVEGKGTPVSKLILKNLFPNLSVRL